MKLRTVSALCVSGRSIYKHLPGVVAYCKQTKAQNYNGGTPVVAHPPCRLWSKYLWRQAKPDDASSEMALGLWCVEQVIQNGGVLEQPAGSRLFTAAGLPLPGGSASPFLYTLYIEQSWFGFYTPKKTWLLVSGVPRKQLPEIPFRFRKPAELALASQSSAGRSRTVPALAAWLVSVARSSWWNLPVNHWTEQNR